MRYIEPITARVWSDAGGEHVNTCEVIGYEVRSETGALLGSGETRAEALEDAQVAILLPTRRLVRS